MLMDIILYLLQFIQYQHKQICWLLNFICRYIPLKQWPFDDSHSPKYQKFKIDKLLVIKAFVKQDWQFLIEYYQWKYGKPLKAIQRRNGKSIPEDTVKPGKVFTTDETYIKVKGIKTYIWFIMDAASRSVIGYQVSDNRSVGPYILAMRMAFRHFKELPKNFKFIADGYSAYPLAAMEFAKKFKDTFTFNITQVIGLTNDDAVSKEFRPYKQMIERLNRTHKASYRPTNGFDNYDGANYDLALWDAYYNFLRPHKHVKYQVLNKVDMLDNTDNTPGKWQLLIFLGQQTILSL